MTTITDLLTAEEFCELAFERPSELVRGEVVEMTSPGGWHGQVCSNASFLIQQWVRGQTTLWNVPSNDAGVKTEHDPDSVRGPDVYAVRRDRLPNGQLPQGHLSVAPELCVEVFSPSDRWPEVVQKVGEYLGIGVREVWVIDPGHRRLHVFRSDDEPTVLNEDSVFQSGALPGLKFRVQELFFGI